MYLLKAYDYEDGSEHNLAVISLDGNSWKDKRKELRIARFLADHYAAWINGLNGEKAVECKDDIQEAAARLVRVLPAECCGDCLSLEEIQKL